MADETATGSVEYDVKIEDVGPAMKRVTITVPSSVVAEKLEESLGVLVHDAALPGFRRGHAPRKLLERRFGSQVRDETKNRLMNEAYTRVFEQHGVQAIGPAAPTVPPEDVRLEDGKPLSFAVEVEVVPEFGLPGLEGIALYKPILEITDEQVEDRIRRQQLRLGTPTALAEGFQEGDRLVGAATVRVEGRDEPLANDNRAAIVYPGSAEGGRGNVFGLMVDGLESLLSGRRVGDQVTIETVGPEGHEREDLRGKKITVDFRITAAERVAPAPLEQLVSMFGVGSEEHLREQMRLALQHQRDQEQADAMRKQVHAYLLQAVEMQLPERLTAAQAARTLEDNRLHLLEQGLSVEEVDGKVAELRSASEAHSRNSLKLFFVLHRLAEHFKVDVSEQEVNGRVATIALQHGQRPDQVRSELSRAGRLGEVARMIRHQKAADRVIAKAVIREIPADEWNRLVEAAGGVVPAPAARS
jgi:trigger factor